MPDENKSFSHQTIFLVHGITCLIGWFVVLNALDYFQSIFPGYDVYAYFLLFLLIGYLITVVLFRKISKRYAIQRIIGIGLIICTISLISLLLIGLLFSQVDTLGFILSIIMCLVIGVSSNIVQLSYFSIINFVSEKVISRFTLGTALSGLSLTIIRIILTAIFGVEPHFFPILIYFLIACAVQIADLFLNNIFCRSQYFL